MQPLVHERENVLPAAPTPPEVLMTIAGENVLDATVGREHSSEPIVHAVCRVTMPKRILRAAENGDLLESLKRLADDIVLGQLGTDLVVGHAGRELRLCVEDRGEAPVGVLRRVHVKTQRNAAKLPADLVVVDGGGQIRMQEGQAVHEGEAPAELYSAGRS